MRMAAGEVGFVDRGFASLFERYPPVATRSKDEVKSMEEKEPSSGTA